MNNNVKLWFVIGAMHILFIFLLSHCSNAQQQLRSKPEYTGIYQPEELAAMFTKPAVMGEYLPAQSGPLRKPDGNGG